MKLLRIILTSLLLLGAWLVGEHYNLPLWQMLLVYLVPYLLIGYDVLWEAVEGIMEGNPFEESFLMSLATLGALLIGFLPEAEPQLPEAVFVMLFFQVGELFEHYADSRSRKSIAQLMDIRPDTAYVERDGAVVEVHPDTLRVGDTIVVRPGEKIPVDGTVLEGTSSLNTVALTGESLPRDVASGDSVASGCVNLSGVLRVRVGKSFGDSTASKIIALVENSAANKSKSESFIRRFARVYTPIVVVAALLLAFVPPFFSGESYADAFATWLYRALTFLVVSCPCALVVSVPLSFFGGIGGASRKGILIKGGNHMDALAHLGTVVLDKTGTLTRGVFAVDAVHPDELSAKELLHLAAHVEHYSHHPIAAALQSAYGPVNDRCTTTNVHELAGKGVTAVVNGRTVAVGNERMMEAVGAKVHPCKLCAHHPGTVVHVALNGQYAGHVVISDQVKPDAREAIQSLRHLGVEQIVMLTGDKEAVASRVAQQVGVDSYSAGLLPAGKVERVEQLLKECSLGGKALAFVGDGINDAPVLARADVGIAMGAMGADAAIDAADVVLMDDKPSKIAEAIRIARRTIANARQNVVFAIAIKLLVLLLASIGVATMGLAVFADVGVMVLCVLNAMRTLRA